MDSSDYELVKKEELDELRDEIKKLKENSVGNYESSLTLIEGMDRLAEQISRLVRIFEHANKELYDEYNKGYQDESTKLEKLITQNERIAKGILAVADLVQRGPASAAPSAPEVPKPSVETPAGYPLVEDTQKPGPRRSVMREFQ